MRKLYSLSRVIRTLAALLSLDAMGIAFAQAPDQFSVERVVNFAAGTARESAQWRKIPAAREIVEGEFVFAKEDLDGDGRPELILLARSSSLCRDGGCAMLILRKNAQGIEPLLAAKVSGKLALTKERVDGYRALALLDGTGRIAIGNRSGSPLFGKQVVYPMRSRAQAPSRNGTDEITPAKVTAGASANSDSIELIELIKLFMQPMGGPSILGDWTFGAKPGSPIYWQTSGIQETAAEEQKAGYHYHRVGEVILTIDGKPTHQVLEKHVVPGTWTISLLGAHGGFTRATISAPNSQELGTSILEGLKGKLPLRLYRCKTPSISSGNKVYQIQGTGKKPFWINEEWSCGSAGCGVSLDIVFTKKEADKFECF